VNFKEQLGCSKIIKRRERESATNDMQSVLDAKRIHYEIGFESILGPLLVSFFILTPLPHSLPSLSVLKFRHFISTLD